MFDWLKEILGDSYTEEIDKKVAAEIGKGFVSKADFNTKNEAVKTLTETLAARDGQLEALKDVDAAGMKAEIERLQGENKTAMLRTHRGGTRCARRVALCTVQRAARRNCPGQRRRALPSRPHRPHRQARRRLRHL